MQQFVEGPEEPNLVEKVPFKMPNTIYKFKICLVGDGGTGKTTFINKVLNGDFISKYYATQGAVTKFLTLSLGDNSFVKYEVWDTAGQEKNVGLKDGYYIGAIAGFFFYDSNSRETMANIPKHMKAFYNACGVDKPKMYILANKIDIAKSLSDFSKYFTKVSQYNPEVIQISAKTNYNFVLPFEKLTRYLINDYSFMFTPNICLEQLKSNYDIFAQQSSIEDASKFADLIPEE
ncbi:GTP-binding nuclear protein gsp1/Ran [Glugoides intestinalis]